MALIVLIFGLLLLPFSHCARIQDLVGKTWRFQSTSNQSTYLHHQHSNIRMKIYSKSNSLNDGFAWNVVPGLCGIGISFETKKFPGYFLRQLRMRVGLAKFEDSETFRKRACFIPVEGLHDADLLSFRSFFDRHIYFGSLRSHVHMFFRIYKDLITWKAIEDNSQDCNDAGERLDPVERLLRSHLSVGWYAELESDRYFSRRLRRSGGPIKKVILDRMKWVLQKNPVTIFNKFIPSETGLNEAIDLSRFGNMKLKHICLVLQNYYQIAENRGYRDLRTGTEFKFRIGGSDSSFKLAQAIWGKKQLLYITKSNKKPRYSDIFDQFDALSLDGQKTVGRFMLDTYRSDLLNQPSYEDYAVFRRNTPLQEATRDFIVLTIPESASPDELLLKHLLEKQLVSYVNPIEGIPKSGRSIGADLYWEYLLEAYLESNNDVSLRNAMDLPYQYQGGTQKAREFLYENQDKILIPKEMTWLASLVGNDLIYHEGDASEKLARNYLTDKPMSETSMIQSSQIAEELAYDVKSKEDVKYIKEKVKDDIMNQCSEKRRRRRRSVCEVVKKAVLDEDSVHIEGSKLTYEFKSASDHEIRYKLKTDIDEKRLFTKKRLNSKESVSKAFDNFKKAYAGYGLAMSVFGSIGSFEEGHITRGSVNAAQSIHSIGSLSGLNEKLSKISTKALSKIVVKGAEKFGVEVGEKALSKLSILTEDIPIVGTAFDIYFIANDISDLKKAKENGDRDEIVLSSAHLFLDATTLVLSLLGPETEPIVIALSIIRMSIDDFYIDISTEMKKAHGVIGKSLAFFKGFAEGYADFITGGMLRALRNLDEQQNKDEELLGKLSKPESYYEVKGSNCDGNPSLIDFTSGEYSGVGGEIKFVIGDDDSFVVEITGVPAKGGEKKTIKKRIRCPGLQDIVLGVGESKTAKWKKETAKLWFVIPVKHAEVIDKLEDNAESLYGSYTGNSKNNTFYAVQGNLSSNANSECKQIDGKDEINLRLTNYHYILHGMAGNDTFFLGPQTSNVNGGEGSDIYRLMSTGGKTVIDNFALDQLQDALLLNISQSHVVCKRERHDLFITYCGTHVVIIKEFFYPVANEFRRHLVISTNDGIQMKVIDTDVSSETNGYNIDCVPHIVDKRQHTDGQVLDLSKSPFTYVTTVMGSRGDDVIIGNELDNYIVAGAGRNRVSGGDGIDTYILRSTGVCNYVDNYAEDGLSDKLLLPVSYHQITLEKTGSADLKILDSNEKGAEKRLCVVIGNWFLGKKYKHLTFITQDHIVFLVKDVDGKPKKNPFMLDYSTSTNGIELDLKKNENSLFQNVITIVDSAYQDKIIANDASNFISTKGMDFIKGNGGTDVYKVVESCTDTVINNCASDMKQDIMFIDVEFTQISLQRAELESLSLKINSRTIVRLQDWFKAKEYRHLLIRTSDGVTAELPANITEMVKWKNKVKAVEISLDQEDCKYGLREYNLKEERYKAIKRFTSRSDKCSYKVIGNDQSNYIDPGPGNLFGKQYLEGGKGADVYVIGYRYGQFNEINNYAEDDEIDMLDLNIGFQYILVQIQDDSLILTSKLRHDNISVTLKNFLLGKKYNHILMKSSDNVLCKLSADLPHIRPLIVDYRVAMHSQIQNISQAFSGARVTYGSKSAKNIIHGGDSTVKVSGGLSDDMIVGGILGETIEGYDGNDELIGNGGNDIINGGDGNDTIFGNEGNDAIFGGSGADHIDGGKGMDTAIFVGDVMTAKGVSVSLSDGHGNGSDAEGDTFSSIESVIGSEFDDIIEGNDCDNILSGKAGNDTLVAHGGTDVLIGGDGRDFYNLTKATGWKFINNFANDNLQDFILLGKSKEHPCFYSFGRDLFFHFEMTQNRILDVKIIDWYKRKHLNQHLSLIYKDEGDLGTRDLLRNLSSQNVKTKSDGIWSFFSKHAKLTVLHYSSKVMFLALPRYLSFIMQRTGVYQIKLNYVTEGVKMKSKRVTERRMLIDNLPSGVVTTISLSLYRCSQVLATSTPTIVRTKPNPPVHLRVRFASAVSITVGWALPSAINDPNREYYEFRCIAYADGKIIFEKNTGENTTSCLFDRLHAKTKYILRVFSLAGSEQSDQHAELTANTLSICEQLNEPDNGEILKEVMDNRKGLATLACNTGFQLTEVDSKGARLRKLAQTIDVPCNFTAPCLQWLSSRCVTQVQCLRIECSEIPLKNRNLVHFGRREFFHGYTMSVSCQAGYSFKEVDTQQQRIACLNGEWIPLPECRKRRACLIKIPHNGAAFSSNQRLLPPFNVLQDGQTVKYRCHHGYILSGAESVSCQDGTVRPSSGEPPMCNLVPCSTISSPSNGVASTGTVRRPMHGSVYYISCNDGYYLTGPRRKRCNAGEWFPGAVSRCNPKACTSPTSQRCYNGGTCFNAGNTGFYCNCKSEWSGKQCKSRIVIESSLDFELRKSLSENGGTSHSLYTSMLYSFLTGRYPDYRWFIVSYPPRRGWDRHAMTGWYLHYFETHNRNLVVAWRRKQDNININTNAVKSKAVRLLQNRGCSFKNLVSELWNIARKEWKVPAKLAIIIRGEQSVKFSAGGGFTKFYECGKSGFWLTKRKVFASVSLFY